MAEPGLAVPGSRPGRRQRPWGACPGYRIRAPVAVRIRGTCGRSD